MKIKTIINTITRATSKVITTAIAITALFICFLSNNSFAQQEKINALDASLSQLLKKRDELERNQAIFEQKQVVYEAQLQYYGAKQQLSESELQKIRLKSEKLALIQDKSNLGRRSLESDIVFESRASQRRAMEKELKEVIEKENEIDQRIDAIDKKMQSVDNFITSQQQEVEKMAKIYFDAKSSLKIE